MVAPGSHNAERRLILVSIIIANFCLSTLHHCPTDFSSSTLDHCHTSLPLKAKPPVGENRVEDLGRWPRREFHVSGKDLVSSSVDIVDAGVCCFSIVMKAEEPKMFGLVMELKVFFGTPSDGGAPHHSKGQSIAREQALYQGIKYELLVKRTKA